MKQCVKNHSGNKSLHKNGKYLECAGCGQYYVGEYIVTNTMPLLTIQYNGFHGRVTKRVRGTCIQVSDRWNVKVSKSGARRFACPRKDCQCGEGLPEELWLPLSSVYVDLIEVTGNYPQA